MMTVVADTPVKPRRRWSNFSLRTLEQIDVHVRQEPGRFSTLGEHLVAGKISGIERGAVWLLSKARSIGPQAHERAESMLQTRGIEGLRVLQGLLALANRHTSSEVDQACGTALSYGACQR